MSKPEPRLYLILPANFEAGLVQKLSEALETGEVASVLLWLDEDEDAPWEEAVAAFLPVCHARAVPLIIGGAEGRAVLLGGDGIHLETNAAHVRAAQKAHAPRLMVGAGGFASRHDAMLAAEAGVDYVFFGAADPARERPIPATTILILTEWWSDLFQVPCVAYAGSAGEAEALAAVGADFIAAGGLVWNDSKGAAAAVEDLAGALRPQVAAS